MLKRLTVILDWDDVCSPCNEVLLKMLNKAKNSRHRLSEITCWDKIGEEIDERLDFLTDPEFYQNQVLYPGVAEGISELIDSGCAVKICTAVDPRFAGFRISRILTLLSGLIDPEDIIIAGTKSVVHGDIMLDDGLHNIKASSCTYPVLMRRPWNASETGCLAVNDFKEFVFFVKKFILDHKKATSSKILAIVAPSGYGKTCLQDELVKEHGFQKVVATTTRKKRPNESETSYNFVSKEEFERLALDGAFIETTVYNNEYYGTLHSSLKPEKNILVVDICGAIALKMNYPEDTIIVFLDRDRKTATLSILERNIPDTEKAARILNTENELKNKMLADIVLENTGDIKEVAERLLSLI